jgi:hypothetical protein
MKMQRNAGADPIKNMYFHDWSGGILASDKLHNPAVTLPTAERDCNQPSAFDRTRSGRPSAIKATANPNTPPTPSPVKNLKMKKSFTSRDNALNPVLIE